LPRPRGLPQHGWTPDRGGLRGVAATSTSRQPKRKTVRHTAPQVAAQARPLHAMLSLSLRNTLPPATSFNGYRAMTAESPIAAAIWM
jgi:hypothetical protein